MKNILTKTVFTFCTMMAMCMLLGTVVEAKSSTVTQLNNQETYYYDLNGDGESDRIYCSVTRSASGYATYRIYINGEMIGYKDNIDEGADIYIADFDTKDKYKEIGVAEGIMEHGYDCTTFYRYKKGKLKKYFRVKEAKMLWRYSIAEEQPGNGRVVLLSDTPVKANNLGQYYVKVTYKVSNGKLKKVAGNTYTVRTDHLPYKLTKRIKIRKSRTNGKTKYTLKKGTTFYLKKVYVSKNKIKYIYIKTSTGKKGWVKLPKGEFLEMKYGWG